MKSKNGHRRDEVPVTVRGLAALNPLGRSINQKIREAEGRGGAGTDGCRQTEQPEQSGVQGVLAARL